MNHEMHVHVSVCLCKISDRKGDQSKVRSWLEIDRQRVATPTSKFERKVELLLEKGMRHKLGVTMDGDYLRITTSEEVFEGLEETMD